MRAQIEATIQKYGEPIELTSQTDGITRFITASVQAPLAENIVNDFDLTGFIVYIRPSDVPEKPTKFDRVYIRGQIRAVEAVEEETLSGVVVAYIMRVRG